jgi:hypothetical protein
MSADAITDLTKAVRAALSANAAVNDLVAGRIFATWDNPTSGPAIRLSFPTVRPFEIDGTDSSEDGSETDLWVHVFTDDGSPAACADLASKVRAALNRQVLTLDNSHTVALDYRSTVQGAREADAPKLHMRVVQFVALTVSK